MESPELRSARREDVSVMSAMQRASLVETYEPFLGRVAVEEFSEAGNVEQCFEARWRQATVATVGNEIVGIAVLEDALLDLIWVTPTMRSKGIGSR